MLDTVKKLKTELAGLYTHYDNIAYIIELRDTFLKDPVGAVKSANVDRGVDTAILKYVSIFELAENLELAKDDALAVLNNSITSEVKLLGESESAVIIELNAVIGVNDSSIKLLLEDIRMPVVASATHVAGKSLPHAELFEKRLVNNMQIIINKLGVNTPGYIDWLYGIATEIRTDNMSELLDTNAYANAETYAVTHVPIRASTDYTALAAKLDTNTKELSPEYNGLVHATLTPTSKISGLSIIKDIASRVAQLHELFKLDTHRYAFSEFNKTQVLKDVLAKSLEDPSGVLDDALTERTNYANFIHNLSVVISTVCENEYTLAIELNKYRHVQDTLSNATLT